MNIYISNFKRKFFILIVILAIAVTATETLIYLSLNKVVGYPWIKLYTSKQYLLDKEWDYLIIADSFSLLAIDPAAINDRLVNLSFPALQPVGAYLVLKRYLLKHKPPKIIFFSLTPRTWGEIPGFSLEFLPYFLHFNELQAIWNDLSGKEKLTVVKNLIPSLKGRPWVKIKLFTRAKKYIHTLVTNRPQRMSYTDKRYNILNADNRGFILAPNSHKALSTLEPSKLRYITKIRFNATKRNIKYFDLFARLAEKNNIKIVVYETVDLEQIYKSELSAENNKLYSSFIKMLEDRYPFIIFDHSYPPYLPNKYFTEAAPAHPNKRGAEEYTQIFKTKIFDVYSR